MTVMSTRCSLCPVRKTLQRWPSSPATSHIQPWPSLSAASLAPRPSAWGSSSKREGWGRINRAEYTPPVSCTFPRCLEFITQLLIPQFFPMTLALVCSIHPDPCGFQFPVTCFPHSGLEVTLTLVGQWPLTVSVFFWIFLFLSFHTSPWVSSPIPMFQLPPIR